MILATLYYLHHDGHRLMLHRVKRTDDIHASKWNGLPKVPGSSGRGGKFDPGESPEECVVRPIREPGLLREVRDESGLEICSPRPVREPGLLRLHGQGMFPGFKGADWYVFVFMAEKFSGELKENGEGYLKWIPDMGLESLPLWPIDHIFLPWLQGEMFFSAKFVYEGEEYLRHDLMFYP